MQAGTGAWQVLLDSLLSAISAESSVHTQLLCSRELRCEELPLWVFGCGRMCELLLRKILANVVPYIHTPYFCATFHHETLQRCFKHNRAGTFFDDIFQSHCN